MSVGRGLRDWRGARAGLNVKRQNPVAQLDPCMMVVAYELCSFPAPPESASETITQNRNTRPTLRVFLARLGVSKIRTNKYKLWYTRVLTGRLISFY